jgi:hypothetical protein
MPLDREQAMGLKREALETVLRWRRANPHSQCCVCAACENAVAAALLRAKAEETERCANISPGTAYKARRAFLCRAAELRAAANELEGK